METQFNFKSQPATSCEQSERLLALGLKKETADMALVPLMEWDDGTSQEYFTGIYGTRAKEDAERYNLDYIPAWSLDRLRELIPENLFTGIGMQYYRVMYNNTLCYENGDETLVSFGNPNIYDRCIACIQWLIIKGYFNEEYLDDTLKGLVKEMKVARENVYHKRMFSEMSRQNKADLEEAMKQCNIIEVKMFEYFKRNGNKV